MTPLSPNARAFWLSFLISMTVTASLFTYAVVKGWL